MSIINFCRLKSYQVFAAVALPAAIKVLLPFGEIFFNTILTCIISAVILAWLYQVGERSYLASKEYSLLSFKKFKINFWYSVIFSLFIGLVLLFRMQPSLIESFLFYLIIPMQFYLVYSLLYIFYFVAKSVKSTVLARVPIFSEYLPEIIQIWFFPIGIWWLQPSINEMWQARHYSDSEARK